MTVFDIIQGIVLEKHVRKQFFFVLLLTRLFQFN